MYKLFPIAPLGQNAVISMGQSPDSSTVKDLDAVGLPFLQGNAEFGKKHPSPKYSCINPPRIGDSGSTLISVRAPVGQTNIADRDYCIGRGLAAVKSNQYGPTLFRAIMAQQDVALKKVSQGTTFEAIGRDDLFYLLIPQIPTEEVPLLERILDTLDTQIQKTEALITKLEKIKEGLLHDLLTRGIDENGQLRPTPEQAPELYKESTLGLIPKEWSVGKLTERATLPKGQVNPLFSPYKTMVLVAPDHIESGTARLILKETAEEQNAISGKYLFAPGDVLYSKIRPYLRKVILADFDGLCSADMYPLRPSGETCPRFLLSVILGHHFSKFAESVSMRSGFPKINRTELAEFNAAWPTFHEQCEISSYLTSAEMKVAKELEVLSKLEGYKKGLMDDLLSGRVRVTPLLKDAV